MKQILFILIVCISLARVAEASSSQMSAATLAEKCYKGAMATSPLFDDLSRSLDAHLANDDIYLAATACLSYIDGVLDGNTEDLWCPKVAVSKRQLRDIFLRYVERHADLKFNAAYLIVLAAMAETFPCGVSTK